MDWIHNLPHNSPMLNQLGQPGGGQQIGQGTKVSISVNTIMNRSIIDICGWHIYFDISKCEHNKPNIFSAVTKFSKILIKPKNIFSLVRTDP